MVDHVAEAYAAWCGSHDLMVYTDAEIDAMVAAGAHERLSTAVANNEFGIAHCGWKA